MALKVAVGFLCLLKAQGARWIWHRSSRLLLVVVPPTLKVGDTLGAHVGRQWAILNLHVLWANGDVHGALLCVATDLSLTVRKADLGATHTVLLNCRKDCFSVLSWHQVDLSITERVLREVVGLDVGGHFVCSCVFAAVSQ